MSETPSTRAELEHRVRAAVRVIAEEPALEHTAFLPAPTPRRWTRRLAPVAVAAAVIAAVAFVPGLRGGDGAAGPGTPDGAPVLPQEFGAMSLLTASLSDAPLHQPGIAVLRQRVIGSFFGLTQVVVVGADGRTYRRVDLAEERGATEADGEWSPAEALLSPDGRHAAVGDNRGGATEIPVLDLVTGQRRDYPLPAPMAYELKAWSPDGRRLALAREDTAERVGDRFQSSDGYPLAVLDLDTGMVTTLPDVVFDPLGSTVQFSATGSLGVPTVQDRNSSAPTSWLTVVDASGAITSTMRIPEGSLFGGWTPDGDPVLFTGTGAPVAAHVVRLTDGGDVRPPVPIPGERAWLLGWRSPTVLLARVEDVGIATVDLSSGSVDVLSTFDSGLLTHSTGASTAARLIAAASVEPVSPARGPWPAWAIATLAVLALAVGALAVRRIFRLRSR
ncbi:TolB family protein [Catellatospora sichuanensis]|uniref:TolB family protein n=1 Tax=Catellatospora sichuanensis TaxID=1969805 RepID=UPI00118421B9|nr:hypothetical protein [Catellatospora sichuanensis]